MNHPHFEEVLHGYITAMLWSSVDTHPETNEDLDSLEEFELSDCAKLKASEIVTNFLNENLQDCNLYHIAMRRFKASSGWGHLGHDLWLTSAGHGAGFWDRGLLELGERLTKASEAFAVDCYLGDDLKVYLS